MSRINAFIFSSADLMSMESAIRAKKATKQVLKNRNKIIAILFEAMQNIQKMAVKNGVSQFEGLSDRRIDKHLRKLSVVGFKQYLKMVKEGADLREQRAFVKMFSKSRNRKVIKAAAKG